MPPDFAGTRRDARAARSARRAPPDRRLQSRRDPAVTGSNRGPSEPRPRSSSNSSRMTDGSFRRGSKRRPRPGAGPPSGFASRTVSPPAETPNLESRPNSRARRGNPRSPGMICSLRQSAALATAASPEAAPAAPRSPSIEPRANESSEPESVRRQLIDERKPRSIATDDGSSRLEIDVSDRAAAPAGDRSGPSLRLTRRSNA